MTGNGFPFDDSTFPAIPVRYEIRKAGTDRMVHAYAKRRRTT